MPIRPQHPLLQRLQRRRSKKIWHPIEQVARDAHETPLNQEASKVDTELVQRISALELEVLGPKQSMPSAELADKQKALANLVMNPGASVRVYDFSRGITGPDDDLPTLTQQLLGRWAPATLGDDVCAPLYQASPASLKSKFYSAPVQQASPLYAIYSRTIANASEEEIIELCRSNVRYEVQIMGKTKQLRPDQIMTLVAVQTGNSFAFGVVTKAWMLPGYVKELIKDTGLHHPICDMSCLVQGAYNCARMLFEVDNPKFGPLGVTLIRHFFENYHHSDKVGDKFTRKHELKRLTAKTVAALFADWKQIEKLATQEQQDMYQAKGIRTYGALSAIMYQAAFEHALQKTKDRERLSKILTILIDVSIVAIAGALASHAPPALAFIPPAMTLVSTHIVPAIVGETDFASPIIHTRGMIKMATARSITELDKNGRMPSYEEMQKRAFFRDMFLQAWDVIPDLCARRI